MKKYIVVGAGIVGAATAYHLAKAGVQVSIVDRQDKGQATDAAAGIVCPWLTQRRNKAWYLLAKNGARYYPALIKQLEADGEYETGYRQVGALSLHTNQRKLDQMEERAYKRIEDAPEIGRITRLTAAETKKFFPPVAETYSSLHISGAARVNGRALCKALIQAARKHGANFIEGEAQLLCTGKKIAGIKVNGKQILGEQVIMTAGAWAAELLQPVGVTFLIRPQKAQIIHLQLPTRNTERWPVVMPPNNQYILACEDGRIIVGSTHEDQAGFDTRITAAGMHEILDKAFMVAPGLKQSSVLETRVGFRPVAPGFLPVMGALPGFEGILVANGLGASGLTVGPYVGEQLAKLALGQKIELNLADYDLAGAIEEV